MDEARRIQVEIFRRMSPQRKLELMMQLYYTARRLKAAGLRAQHPDWTDEQIEQKVREIFLNARS